MEICILRAADILIKGMGLVVYKRDGFGGVFLWYFMVET